MADSTENCSDNVPETKPESDNVLTNNVTKPGNDGQYRFDNLLLFYFFELRMKLKIKSFYVIDFTNTGNINLY